MDAYSNGTLASGQSVINTMTVQQSQTVHFALAATVCSGVSVRMSNYDSLGNLVGVLQSETGQTATMDTYFDTGTYTVRFELFTPIGMMFGHHVRLARVRHYGSIGPRSAGGPVVGTGNSNSNTIVWCGLRCEANNASGDGGNRTHDLRIKSPMLYRLSYVSRHARVAFLWRRGRRRKFILGPGHREAIRSEYVDAVDRPTRYVDKSQKNRHIDG